MPLDPGAEQVIVESDAEVAEDTEYTVTAKPGSEWYGIVFGPSGQATIGDTAGAPVSLNLTAIIDGDDIVLAVTGGASATGTEEGQSSMVSLNIKNHHTT